MWYSNSIWRGANDAVTVSETLTLCPRTAPSPPSPLPSPSRDLQLLLVSASTARDLSKLRVAEREFDDPAFRGLREDGQSHLPQSHSALPSLPYAEFSQHNSPCTQRSSQLKSRVQRDIQPTTSLLPPNFFPCWKDLGWWVLLMSQRAKE